MFKFLILWVLGVFGKIVVLYLLCFGYLGFLVLDELEV